LEVLLAQALHQNRGGVAPRPIQVARGKKTIHIDMYDLLTQGDVVTVPYKTRVVSIQGKIKRPAIFELRAEETMADLIDMAGQLDADADRERIQIRRIAPRTGIVLTDIDVTRLKLARVKLQDRDQIVVESLPGGIRGSAVRIEGAGVIHPGTYELTRDNQKLGDFLRMVGIFEDAVRDRVTLIRIGEKFVKHKIILDLDVVIPQGFRLESEDHLFISSEYRLAGGDKHITIRGHAKNPGSYVLPRDLTLYDILYLYAGLTDPDFRAQAYLPRGDIIRIDKTTGEREYVPFDLDAVLNGEEDHQLEANDEIEIYSRERFTEDKHVTIEGEVLYPGQYELTQGMDMTDLLTQAGETTEEAHVLEAEVTRLVPGREPPSESFIVSLDQSEMQLYELRHRDMIFIRRIPFWAQPNIVTIGGEVKFAGRYVLTEFNERVSRLVERSGGLSQSAFLEGVRFTRSWDGEERRVALDMEKALSGDEDHDIILQGGDEIYIPPNNFAVNVQGLVRLPGIVQHLPGKSSGYYVDTVGGYLENADAASSHIIRANGLVLKATRRFWFDPEVPPGSTLVVPEQGPRRPLWRHPRLQGIASGLLASGLVWYSAR